METLNSRFDTFIELNDYGESVLCCDYIKYSKIKIGDKALVVNLGSNDIVYRYDNVDTLVKDNDRIKEVIEKHLFYKYIKRDGTIITNEEDNYADNY